MIDTVAPLQSLFIATPIYSNPVPLYNQAVLGAVMDLMQRGIAVNVSQHIGNCYIHMARNELCRRFLESDCDRMLFIDGDVGFPTGAVWQVAATPYPVVCGVYPKKEDGDLRWPLEFEYEEMASDPSTGLLIAKGGVPTGFLCIHRSVLEALQEHVPQYDEDNGVTQYAYFETPVKERRAWGEDFDFCHKWQALGGQIYVHPHIGFTHTGPKSWRGCYAEWWAMKEPSWKYIPGFNTCPTLYQEAVDAARDGASFVEVGAWKGKSAAFMAELIRDSGKHIWFTVVDHFKGSPELAHDPDVVNGRLQHVFEENTGYITDYIQTVRCEPSCAAAELLQDASCDFVFLDAAHDAESVYNDCYAWWPKVREGGVLAGDDWDFPTVREGVEKFFAQLPEQYGLWQVDKGWKVIKEPLEDHCT